MSKIYFVSPFYPYRGGIAQFSDSLANMLGSSQKVAKINYKRLYPSLLFPGKSQFVDGYDKSEKNIPKGIDSLNVLSSFRLILNIKKEVGNTVLLNVYWMSFFAPILGFICKFTPKKVKKIALIHNLIPHETRFFDSILTRFYVNQQDAFIVLSEKVKQDVLKFKPDAKVLALFHPLYDHFGVKVDKYIAREKYGISSDKKVLLFFGLIREYKGLDVLLHALAELDDSYVLIIAGECYGGFDKYQGIIDRKRLKNKIVHLDCFVPDSEIQYLFSATDVCVLPYKNATQSGVTAVALHFDLPIVATNVGALDEYIKDDFTGKLVPPNNSFELAQALKKVTNPNVLESMTSEIKEFKKNLSWEKFSDELIAFIESV